MPVSYAKGIHFGAAVLTPPRPVSSSAAYAAVTANGQLVPYVIERRAPGPHDVVINILYCGVCHSDIHQARDEWGGSIFPMVPGHEIVGTIARIGERVEKWRVGQNVGVGCFVDSCRQCESCKAGEEQYCDGRVSFTYNGYEQDGRTPTYGGYARRMVVDENYVVSIPDGISLAGAAPLLCAGITTYSPLRHFDVKPGDKVGIVGLGGLGHLGVKFAKTFGCEVTVFSHSEGKRTDAQGLGADRYVVTSEPTAFDDNLNRFHFILDTVSAPHDYNSYLKLLKRDGTMCLVGVPEPTELSSRSLIGKRRRLAGSMIGGIRETQEMLDFCGRHKITADIELIPMQRINDAYERVLKSDVKYRFVIDIGKSL